MLAGEKWTESDPKDDTILALTTCLSKLEGKKSSVLATVHEEKIEPRPAQTIK